MKWERETGIRLATLASLNMLLATLVASAGTRSSTQRLWVARPPAHYPQHRLSAVVCRLSSVVCLLSAVRGQVLYKTGCFAKHLHRTVSLCHGQQVSCPKKAPHTQWNKSQLLRLVRVKSASNWYFFKRNVHLIAQQLSLNLISPIRKER